MIFFNGTDHRFAFTRINANITIEGLTGPLERRLKYMKLVRLLAPLVLLASCVDVEVSPPPPGTGGRPQIACPANYDPVCGVRGSQQKTFGNACMAEANGFSVNNKGECGARTGGGDPIPRGPRTGGGDPIPLTRQSDGGSDAVNPNSVCPQNYSPVCGRNGSKVRNFNNQCLAEVEGYEIMVNGSCDG